MSKKKYVSKYSLPLLVAFCSLMATSISAQNDADDLPYSTREYLENVVADSEADFDFDGAFDLLRAYKKRPLNLNQATEDELQDLRLLNSIQIASLLQYRSEMGKFIDIRELQAVPDFDLETISRLLPFVDVKKGTETFNVPIGKMLYKGRNDLMLRYTRGLELARGFIPIPETDSTPYAGSPDRYYARFRHSYDNRHSWGITMEKDPGETFFRGVNKAGFDFYSAHLYFKDINRTVKAIALGDYNVSLGQGLIVATGFGTGKTSYVMDIRAGGRAIRPYTSINESLYFRGIAGTLALSENIEFTAFGSYKKRDATAIDLSNIDIDFVEGISFSSLQTTGLHRTESEIERKGLIGENNVGGSLKYKTRKFHVAANGLYTKFDSEWMRRYDVYSQFRFQGDRLAQGSVDYGYVYRNFNFFGETAYSSGNTQGWATLNGVLIGLDRTVNLAILHRHYQKTHNTIYGNAFSETFGGSNEQGLYLGLDVKPNYNWQFSAYFDTWQHPWLRSNIDRPSTGYEYLVQAKYRVKRRMEVYVRLRDEVKSANISGDDSTIKQQIDRQRTDLRINLTNKVSKSLTLRNRLELVRFDNVTDPISRGFMIYQDVVYNPIGIPFSFTTRYAIFDTDDYNSRTYAYENDIIGFFSIPAYAYRGTRFYFNLRYKGIRNMTLEARFAQTYLRDRDFFGSGLNLIEGRTRSEVKVQLQYKF